MKSSDMFPHGPGGNPRLLADIGGRYARFALEFESGKLSHVTRLACAEYPSLERAVQAYLTSIAPLTVEHAAMALANPVDGDDVRMTNAPWQFSIEAIRLAFGWETLVVVNDFTALAMALPRLTASDRRQVGPGLPVESSVVGLLGSGTGLGVSGLIPAGDSYVSLGSEGGHTSFAPRDAAERRVLEHAERQFGHVSFERLLSATGLTLIHQALHGTDLALSAQQITRLAQHERDPGCLQTVAVFCNMMGTAASDLAVTLGAKGGIYIGGSIVPGLGSLFEQSGFRQRFEDKGRFAGYLRQIPTYVITAEDVSFLGISAILEAQLRRLNGPGGMTILTQIRRLRPQLPPAEQRVADLVLSQPRVVLNEAIQRISDAAEVSQPTVIRFCRSVGCKGLSDFKLRLASSLSVSVPVTHSQVTRDDSPLDLGVKVLANTANAVLQLRSELQREAIDQAIDLVQAAGRVEIFAVGGYSAVAQDAQTKLLQLGIACAAHADPHLQRLTAQVADERTVGLFICNDGNVPDLLDLLALLKARGARVIAITTAASQLARQADVALIAEHNENAATHLAMVSRVLHLLLIDILVVGLEMRQPGRGVPGPVISHSR